MSTEVEILKAENKKLLETLNEIHNWLVCAPIATAEDMAESFPYMERLAGEVIDEIEGAKK